MELDLSDIAVTLDGTRLNGLEINALITRLAHIRADTAPAVATQWDAHQAVDVCASPAMKVGLTAENRVLIALRHTGLGWCCFDFDLPTAARLSDFIARRTSGVATQSAESADESGHAH